MKEADKRGTCVFESHSKLQHAAGALAVVTRHRVSVSWLWLHVAVCVVDLKWKEEGMKKRVRKDRPDSLV